MVAVGVTIRNAPVERRAVGAVGLAIVLWTFTSLFVRAAHAEPVAFTTYRLWLALPPLALVVAVRHRRGAPLVDHVGDFHSTRAVLHLAGAGFFFAASALTAFAAINETRLLDVTLIGALQPALIIAVAVAFLGERAHRSQMMRAAVAVLGTAIVATSASGSGEWSLVGDLLAVVSLVLSVGWYLYGRVLRERHGVDPFAYMLAVLGAAAVWMLPVAVLSGNLGLHADQVAWAGAMAVVGTGAHLFVVWAHRFIPASVSAPLLLAEPPLVAMAAWMVFGEALGPIEVLGTVIVVWALSGMVRTSAFQYVDEETVDPVPPA